MTIRVAFVGCTHPHIFPRIELLQSQADVELVGCYDPDAHLTSELERQYGLKAYADPEALLDQPGVNFAIIEGWDTANPRYVRMAAGRGQAILLEKPGASSLAAMHEVVDTVRTQAIPFQVGYMLRHGAGVAHAKRILAEGVLGPVSLVRIHAATPCGGSAEIWQSVPDNMGGLCYTDACHAVHLLVYLFGTPDAVTGRMLRMSAGEPITAHGFKKDTLAGLGATVTMPIGGLKYEDAGAAIFSYPRFLATLDMTAWEAHPWVEAWRIEAYGTDGTLHVGIQPSRYQLYVRNPNHGYAAGWHTWDSAAASTVGNSLLVDENYSGEIFAMLDRVRRWDTDNRESLYEAESVIATLDAWYRSDRGSGQSAGVQQREGAH
jgi:predicted dehydrogenase